MATITHLTSVHQRYDIRIFLKECRSLVRDGNTVFLVVADGQGDEEKDGIRILDAGSSRSRFDRMLSATRRVLRVARKTKADVYHLHDPELLPAGLVLKWLGHRVIFDSHEDLPRQILSKTYIHSALRRPVALMVELFERFSCRRFDIVVAATPAIRDKFASRKIAVVNVNNYPLEGELEATVSWSDKKTEVCYVGGIAAIRGIREVVAALDLTRSGARLNLAGRFSEKRVRNEVESLPGWKKVNELGLLSRAGVTDVLGASMAGLVTFHPVPNHIDAQPNKMFEYMSAGVPVIASDFPLWRQIIESNECGICVDPLDPEAIARAIDTLVQNPELARRMGANGRRAVAEKYNWRAEEPKLFGLYRKTLA